MKNSFYSNKFHIEKMLQSFNFYNKILRELLPILLASLSLQKNYKGGFLWQSVSH